MDRREALEDSLEELFSTLEDIEQDNSDAGATEATDLGLVFDKETGVGGSLREHLEPSDRCNSRPEGVPTQGAPAQRSAYTPELSGAVRAAQPTNPSTRTVPRSSNPPVTKQPRKTINPVVEQSVTIVSKDEVKRDTAEENPAKSLSETRSSVPKALVNPDGFEKQLVVFNLDKEQYGVDISAVAEIIRPQPITVVPRALSFVEGVTNLRGSVLPVIDLRKRFGLPVQEVTKETRIVVAEMGDTLVGMVVDAVTEVLRVSAMAVEPLSPIVTTVDSAFITGVARVNEPTGRPLSPGDRAELAEGRLIILLDLGAVLSPEEKADERPRGTRAVPLATRDHALVKTRAG